MCFANRGKQSLDGSGRGQEKPADLKAEDDEVDAFRKRMMLAYRFRPNPLVRPCCFNIHVVRCQFVLLFILLMNDFEASSFNVNDSRLCVCVIEEKMCSSVALQNNPRRPYY